MRSGTRTLRFGSDSTARSAISRLSASRTGMALVPKALASSASLSLWPGAKLPRIKVPVLVMHSRDCGLDVLCEVHDEEELQRALDAGCNLIGANSRDLRTFKVDLETAFRLAQLIPKNVIRVAESGINTGADIARLRAAGYQAFLIGESLMRAKSPGEALGLLLAEAERERVLIAGN